MSHQQLSRTYVRAAAVIYVGDLARMRAFYQGCFGLHVADWADGYVGLRSEAWDITLVASNEALPSKTPAPRRAQTPIKLAFELESIAAFRPVAGKLGGKVEAPASEWQFRNATHCDCVDPEGNVIQLIELHKG